MARLRSPLELAQRPISRRLLTKSQSRSLRLVEMTFAETVNQKEFVMRLEFPKRTGVRHGADAGPQPACLPIKPIYTAEAPRTRLVCFAGAGTSAGFFRFWRGFGGRVVSVEAFAPRGREGLWETEQPTLERNVQEAAAAISRSHPEGQNLVLLGHSFGALLAYEVAQALGCAPVSAAHLIVMARAAPHMAPHSQLAVDLPDACLVGKLRQIGLKVKNILDHSALGPLFLGNLRHDLRQNAQYTHRQEHPLTCPVTAISGRHDPLATPLAMANWQHVTTGSFRHFRFNGGHFFPADRPVRLAWLIKSTLEGLS